MSLSGGTLPEPLLDNSSHISLSAPDLIQILNWFLPVECLESILAFPQRHWPTLEGTVTIPEPWLESGDMAPFPEHC